jgi:hypoxanthine phosphoribosyltransferase
MPNLTFPRPWPRPRSLVDRPTIDKAIAGIADAIARDYKGEVPVFLSIMHGALPFAGQLALELARARRRRAVRLPARHPLPR